MNTIFINYFESELFYRDGHLINNVCFHKTRKKNVIHSNLVNNPFKDGGGFRSRKKIHLKKEAKYCQPIVYDVFIKPISLDNLFIHTNIYIFRIKLIFKHMDIYIDFDICMYMDDTDSKL